MLLEVVPSAGLLLVSETDSHSAEAVQLLAVYIILGIAFLFLAVPEGAAAAATAGH